MDTLSPHPNPHISRDEFVRLRHLQDQGLNDRFRSIDNSIEEVKQGLGDLKVEVRAQFAKIDARFDKIDARFDKIDARFDKIDARFDKNDAQVKEIKIEWLRMSARFQNYILKNPAMRIAPVVVLDRFGEIASPDPQNFPRNAKEFYAMRDKSNERRARMLAYLVGFYDVKLDHQDLSQSDSEASHDGSPKLRVDTTWLAVEMLETILGLNEENFIKFKERAAALARRSPQPPIKRPNPPSTSADEGERKLVSRPSQRVPTKPKSLGSSEKDQVLGEGQSSETSPSQRRIPLAFKNLRSLDSNEDPIESPTNKYSTPEGR